MTEVRSISKLCSCLIYASQTREAYYNDQVLKKSQPEMANYVVPQHTKHHGCAVIRTSWAIVEVTPSP
jgi:hypothetical protein